MNINDFANLVLDGIHPVIEFKKGIEDIESYAESGMRARVTGISFDSDMDVRVKVDYSEFEPFNQALEQPNYYDKDGCPSLTARQAGYYKPLDAYYFEKQDDADKYFGVVEDFSLKLYERYKKSSSEESYVQWLESVAKLYFGL